METGTYAQRLGSYVARLEVSSAPSEVVERLRASLLYGLTMLLASPLNGGVLSAVAPTAASPPRGAAQTLGDGAWHAPAEAAFLNAARIAARGQADTHLRSQAHVGCVVIPAVLALAQARRISGSRLLSAMLAGYECLPRIAIAAARSSARGFRATAIYGPFAAAAASARLLGLDAEQTANALCLAANLSGGLSQCWAEGTEEAQLHVANAARSGVVAALLAEAGMQTASLTFEGSAGFFRAFVGEVPALDISGWETLGTSYKPYPGCALNQSVVESVRRVMAEPAMCEGSVSKVFVAMHPAAIAYPGVNAYGPFATASGAVMSAPFMVEVILRNGTLQRHHFDTLYSDSALNEASRRVQLVADPMLSSVSSCRVTIWTDAGIQREAVFDEAIPFAFGWDQMLALTQKVCREWHLPEPETRWSHLSASIERLEELDQIEPLIEAFHFVNG